MNYYSCDPYYLSYHTQHHPHISATVSIRNDYDQDWPVRVDYFDWQGQPIRAEAVTIKKGETYTFNVPYNATQILAHTTHARTGALCQFTLVRRQTIALTELWQRGRCQHM